MIDEILEKRRKAREAEDWALADYLRDQLKGLGVTVTDTPNGQEADNGYDYEFRQLKVSTEFFKRRIKGLEATIRVLERREVGYNERIAKLVREVLELKFGDVKN